MGEFALRSSLVSKLPELPELSQTRTEPSFVSSATLSASMSPISSMRSTAKPLVISRVYCVIDNSRQAEKRARLYRLTSGANGNAFEETFDLENIDPMRTIVMITEEEAKELVALFASVEQIVSEDQQLGVGK